MADDQNGAQHEEENGNDDDDGYGKSDSSRVRYKNFAVPDPKFGGPPALMDFRWELQLLTVRAVPSGGVQPTPGISVVEIHKLSRYEHALTVDVVEIGEEGEQRPFVALGTGYVTDQGEDQPPRGRLLLYEVDYAHVAKEDGGHEYQVKLREVVRKVMQGSVSVVTKLGRNLIVAVGKSITVFAWDAKAVGIKPIGIYEASQYVVSIQVIKDYILIGDAVNSAQFLVWREEDRSLTQLAKDYEPANVMSVGYVADPPSLGIAVADTSGGLRLLQYAPRSMDSRGGHLLLPMARAHTGTSVSAMVPLRGRDRGPNARYGLAMGTLDGSLAYLGPVEERVFRRLAALQSMMVNALEHTAGANPRAGGGAGGGDRARRHILDGQLLWRFISLDRQFQHQLTRAVGTTVERVLSNLQELDLNAAWGLA
jgi:cleavage and polyadenylation specificity factor subunit 1